MAAAKAKHAEAGEPAFKKISASNPIYGDLTDFLIEEAALLDDDLHNEWLAYLADDISYKMPVRKTVYRRDGAGFESSAFHFDDTMMSLQLRVRRSVDIVSAYDRDPAPRIRRLVTNIGAYETDTAGEYFVKSYILLLRNRFDNPQYDMLSGKREDIIRRTDAGLKLVKRTILLDQSALGAAYLNVFM